MNQELSDIQVFRKGRGTRDQIANICWIIEKAREFQKKKIYFCFIDYSKSFDCVDHNKLWKILRNGNTRPPYLTPKTPVCRSRSNKVKVKSLSHVRLFATPWTVACTRLLLHQAPPSIGFSRQEYWSGLPFPSPGNLPDQWSNPGPPHCRQTLYHLSHQGSPRSNS